MTALEGLVVALVAFVIGLAVYWAVVTFALP